MVFATPVPKRNGPANSATAVMPNATRGWNVLDEIIVATILLESRNPLKNPKASASTITTLSSADEKNKLCLLHHDISDDVGSLVPAVRGVGEMTIYLAHL